MLLVLGAAMLVGGWKRTEQTLQPHRRERPVRDTAAGLAALILPAVFQLVHGGGLPRVGEERVDFGTDLEHLSLGVAIVLISSYVAGLFFSMKTHRSRLQPVRAGGARAPRWLVDPESLLLLGHRGGARRA